MTIDTVLTGAVVLVALIFVVRRFMKPSCSCCANKGCGCQESDGSCPPPATDDKENKERQE